MFLKNSHQVCRVESKGMNCTTVVIIMNCNKTFYQFFRTSTLGDLLSWGNFNENVHTGFTVASVSLIASIIAFIIIFITENG